MKILLTGSGGMVGRNIVDHPEFSLYEWLLPKRSELNLFNFNSVLDYLKKNNPDFIIHAAGRVGGIQANIKSPVDFLIENLDINRNVILAAENLNITRLLNLGSSCMYPKNAENPLTEDLILKGELEPTNEGYALAKIMAQRLCIYTQIQKPHLKYKTIIPCNLYGPYDKFDPLNSHLIPAIITKIHNAKLNNEKYVDIWGDGTARREFMYCGDLVDMIYLSIKNNFQRFDELPNVMNVGVGKDHSVNDYYTETAKVLDHECQFQHDLTKPVGMKQKLVSTKLAQDWGWQSQTDLQTGISKTYDYFKKLNLNAKGIL